MNATEMLIELQNCYDKICECNKIIKDASYGSFLKKIKNEFDVKKKLYLEKEREEKGLKINYENSSDEIKTEREKFLKDEGRMYLEGNSDLKFISSLEKSLENSKLKIKELEDISLANMELEEKVTKEKDDLMNDLNKLKNNFDNYKKESNEKIDKAKDELNKAESLIKDMEGKIPKEILDQFMEIKEAKNIGIAKLQGGVCSACRMKVSTMTIDSIKRGIEIVFCDNCGRILYYDELGEIEQIEDTKPKKSAKAPKAPKGEKTTKPRKSTKSKLAETKVVRKAVIDAKDMKVTKVVKITQ